MLKNITLNAEDKLIKKARAKAAHEGTTLNASFRQWLRQFTNSTFKTEDYNQLMKSLNYAKAGRKFSREEINEG